MLVFPAMALAEIGCAQPASSDSGLAPDIVAAAQHPKGFPSFCSIPAIPTDVRDAGAWKTAVVDTRVAGARLQRQTDPSTWTLDGTDAFAADARREAAAPPPMTPASEGDAEAFTQQLKARATPPPRPR
ncbi:MAG: hypothetical protein JSR86_04925 [Proteobacteria bacterium]|nr:hypothetical protein [Pseudomonadota bacterium]